jgi:recombination protein U
VVQGIPICFDAKETSKEFLPLQNIHEHQIKFMSDFEKQKGISFLIVFFVKYNEYYYLPFSVLREYWIGSLNGKRKSIPYSSFDKKYIIKGRSGYFIHYLEAIKNQLIEEP